MSEISPTTKRLASRTGPPLVVVAAITLSLIWGLSAAILFLAACALCLSIFFLWGSLQTIDQNDQMDFEEAMALAAPSATEEQKRAILRTLKDLEYELSVGKISQEDFDQVSTEYRAEAKRLIYEHDEELKGRLKLAEKHVKARLAQEKLDTKKRKAKRDDEKPSDEKPSAATDDESKEDSDEKPSAATDDESKEDSDEKDGAA
jgi:hypothetical protein